MARVQVLYFAAVRDLMGCPEETLTLPSSVATVGAFARHLETVRPQVQGRLGGVRMALNETFVDTDAPIRDGDTVAVIPPVAGG